MGGRCKDCIFGKHSTHPFNDNGYQETEILERTHIDIWGPSPTQSAGGVSYFMLLMDGHLSYCTVAFLKTKSADVILNVFEIYHNEAEWQTSKKLKRVRLDMERECGTIRCGKSIENGMDLSLNLQLLTCTSKMEQWRKAYRQSSTVQEQWWPSLGCPQNIGWMQSRQQYMSRT